MITKTIEKVIEPEKYWAIKGWGRILLIIAIAVYGIGMILARISKERRQAICERDGEAVKSDGDSEAS